MKYIVHDRVVRSRLPEGPLAAHIDSFAEWADKQGYVSCSVYRRVLLGACFSQWLGKKGVRLRDVSSEHPSQYLRYRARQVGIGRGDGAALRQLIAFLRCSGLVPDEKTPRRQLTPSEKCAEAFHRYLREDRALSQATQLNYVPFIRSFLKDCFGNGPAKLSQVRRRRGALCSGSGVALASQASQAHDDSAAFVPAICTLSWGHQTGLDGCRSAGGELVHGIDSAGDST